MVVPLVLLAAAIALGGLGGILIGFLAGLIAADRILERFTGVMGWDWIDADRRFRRLARQRRRARLTSRVQRDASDRLRLPYLPDDEGWVAIAPRRRLGIQPIAVESIVGTSDRRKAEAFDSAFRPPEFSKGRWTLMYLAARTGSELPPIEVYRVGDEHYVRDGHHRVSVARAIGADDLDAQVVELIPPST
jgi:hypothetical protein